MGTTTAGLEGVIAGESEICYIDGYQGILSYRGYNIHTLADNAIFEEVIFLLWNGWLPKQAELDRLKQDLVAERGAARRRWSISARACPQAQPHGRAAHGRFHAEPVRSRGAGHVGGGQPPQGGAADVARPPTIVTTFDRLRKGKPLIEGDPNLGFAANFLYTLTGKRPDDVMERAFDVAMTLHADHELNASTFAARVTAATLVGHLFFGHQRHRRAEGAAARRRQPGRDQVLLELGDEDAAVDRGEEHAGAQGEDSGLRPSRLPHGRSARHPPARAVAKNWASAPGTRSSTGSPSAWKRP